MKLSLALAGILAYCAAATPLRITYFNPSDADVSYHAPIFRPVTEEGPHHSHHPEPVVAIASPGGPHQHRPCSGKAGVRPFPSIGELLHRVGLAGGQSSEVEVARGRMGEAKGIAPWDAWKHHVEEMFGGLKGEGLKTKMVPIMEGGAVRILPFHEDDAEGHRHGHGHHDEPHVYHYHHQHQNHGQNGEHPHLRPYGGHHWHHKAHSFNQRLHRAIMHLSPAEAISLAFVLGAGLGSILHLIFMAFLLTLRRVRCRSASGLHGQNRAERRAARRARREARKAAKATTQAEEVLPSYAEQETDRLVEKA